MFPFKKYKVKVHNKDSEYLFECIQLALTSTSAVEKVAKKHGYKDYLFTVDYAE